MDNFNYKKFLAEGKLNEEIEKLNGQEVKFLAQYIADAFTKEDAEGDRFSTYVIYTVGDIDGNSFELDTKATEKTPEDEAKYGTGRGWGGSFRINPVEDGYEIRNSEKGGLVATISDQGEITILDAEQSRAEMGRAKGEETDYMERRKETSDYMEEGEDEVKEIKSNKMKKSELKEMIKAAMMAEIAVEETEVYEADEEEDIKVDTEEEEVEADIEDAGEVDMEVKPSVATDGDKDEIQTNLEAALEAAKELGDQKLVDQIGNSITFFTRQHVVGKAEPAMEEMMDEGDLDEDTMKVNEVEFPMWTKLNK